MTATAGTPELLTAAQVAQIIGVSRTTISRWGSDGKIPVVKVAGTRRYRRDDIERLLQSEQVAS